MKEITVSDQYPKILDLEAIKRILPHRDPFLFLDRGEILGPTKSRAWKTFPNNWEVFKGHFPGHPVVPGAILGEMIGQTASLILDVIPECKNLIGIFTVLGEIKLKGSVHPDEKIVIDAEITSFKKIQQNIYYGTVSGIASVNGRKVAWGKSSFAVLPPEKMD